MGWNRPVWSDFFLILCIYEYSVDHSRGFEFGPSRTERSGIQDLEKPGKIRGHICCDFPVVWMMHSNIYTEIFKT